MLSYVDETERAPSASERLRNVLAVVRFGANPATPRSATCLEAGVPNAPLPDGPRREVWSASGSAVPIDFDRASAAADGRFLFVAAETRSAVGSGIEGTTFDTYVRLLRGVERAGYPHVLRVWNYVPGIHQASAGIDGYMRFCKGRSEAFAAHFGPAFPEQLSAASAVGSPGDDLVVHLLAGRDAGRHVENPRQVAAYRYPEQYGPKSPSFARGTVTAGGMVFVSGTASILGHESVFPGDPVRQTQETLLNVAAVLDAAGVPGREGPLGNRLRSLRVYVRFPGQLGAIRSAVDAGTGTPVPSAWLQAQVCREELLVEIEATARAGTD